MEFSYDYTIDNLEYTDSGEVSKAIINYFGTCTRENKTPIRHKERLEITFDPVKNTNISTLQETTVRTWVDEELTTEIVNSLQSNLRSRLDESVTNLEASVKNGLPFEENLDSSQEFDILINIVRQKRNRLLAETDHLALADNTLSSDMTTYRQSLRDITNNLTTVEDVNSVTWPTKPGA
jgi:hypothetical protein